MKYILNIIVLLAATVLTCHAEKYTLNVSEFTSLKVVETIDVDYHCCPDSAGLVTFECADPSVASTIGISNDNGELTLSYTVMASEAPKELPVVKVYSSFLTKVENSGDGTVRVIDVAPCPNFSATQIGNGKIVVRDISATRVRAKINTGRGTVILYGKCDEAVLNMTGTGVIQADGLESNKVKISAFGTGSVGCWPVKLLKIHGMGSTKVYYKGNPEVRNRAVGVKVERIK